jgi:hypothetical protein
MLRPSFGSLDMNSNPENHFFAVAQEEQSPEQAEDDGLSFFAASL